MIQSGTFWLLLAISAAAYWLIVPARRRLWFVAAVSIAYMGSIEPWSVAALFVWTVAFYKLAPLAARPGAAGTRAGAGLMLAILAYLAYFKYIPPLIAALGVTPLERNLIIPLGISYYSFKFIHYMIEVARGNVGEHTLGEFACYIFLFPIFTAGPIERFDHFRANLQPRWDTDAFAGGAMRIVYGLIKMFVICELFLTPLFRGIDTSDALLFSLEVYPTWKVWGFCTLKYAIFYLEFSAYCDIAIGASRMFGIGIMENFNFPIIANSISNFWKRWHMTLSGWCQHYVYMPTLAATRSPYLAVYAVFFVMGMWHSGTWERVGWGLYHATGVSIYMLWTQFKRKMKWKNLDRGAGHLAGIAITQIFVIPSVAFLVVEHKQGIWGAIRILAKLVFIDVGA